MYRQHPSGMQHLSIRLTFIVWRHGARQSLDSVELPVLCVVCACLLDAREFSLSRENFFYFALPKFMHDSQLMSANLIRIASDSANSLDLLCIPEVIASQYRRCALVPQTASVAEWLERSPCVR